MTETNHALARIFREIGLMYEYLGPKERFRSLAYIKASRILDGLQDDVSTYIHNNKVKDLAGIGESISDKIIEYIQSGKINKYEQLKKQVPAELIDLINVSGFGPQSIRTIHDKLHIKTKGELIDALRDGRIQKLKNFGLKKTEKMLRGLKLQKESEERITLSRALDLSNKLSDEIKKFPEVIKLEIAGSIRRKKETIGDIDVLITCNPGKRKKVVDRFVSMKNCKLILAKGETKASILIKDLNRQVDLRIVNENEWGAALLYFTGSKEHNVALRTVAKERGLKINEYGVFKISNNKFLAGKNEEEIYKILGYQWVPPEMRENIGELKLASENKLPKLITIKDIRGDMQMHSKWSDGTMKIEELARFVRKYFNYEYIVLTDHSKSQRIAGGMNEKMFQKQMLEIKNVNKKLGKDFIKCGAEVDILPDSTLDLDNSLLSKLDWVCASIHSGFSKDNTERLVNACKNPFVNCIGHPSGRLIGKREPYYADWTTVFKMAAKTGTAMEINCQPDRMDLNDQLAFQARKAGVMLTISTDSHSENNFHFMQLGIGIARRAWCTKKNILNSGDWKSVEMFRNKKIKLLL